ncbi:unnamed protein product [Phaedon cochleariae]|uniref:PHD-type domain-containing protein n=1 Tax=Phaedon cochleariae TaxID=80249 RepID=A0A9N9SGL6_PHACE|nr:unnamed protein product [Phaedon cochleariae]
MTKKKLVDCKGCKINITKTQSCMRCNGDCQGWFHKKCTKLNNEDYDIFCDKKSNKKWICNSCEESSSSSENEDSHDESNLEEMSGKLINNNGNKKRNSSASKIRGSGTIEKNADPSNRELMQFMTKKFSDLEESVKFNAEVMDELQASIKALTKENAVLRKEQKVFKSRLEDLEVKLNNLNYLAEKEEVEQKNKNVVVFGLMGGDTAKDDIKKILQKLDARIDEGDYNLQTLPSKETRKPVLVKLKDKTSRDRLLEVMKNKKINTLHCGISGEDKRIYINEDLPRSVRLLLNKAKSLKSHNFKYVWCKNGTVYARKDEGERFIRIKNSLQVDSIINS